MRISQCWEMELSEKAVSTQSIMRSLEGVTPAQEMLVWSPHQPCLEKSSQGSSEPPIHPSACESLGATRDSHMARPRVYAESRSQLTPGIQSKALTVSLTSTPLPFQVLLHQLPAAQYKLWSEVGIRPIGLTATSPVSSAPSLSN